MPDDFTITVEPQLIATTLPEHLIRRLEAVWPGREQVDVAVPVAPELAHDSQCDLLEYAERAATSQRHDGVAKRGLVVITEDAPVWSFVTKYFGEPVESERQPYERTWHREDGDLDAIRHATMLICRVSGTAIPPLPRPDRG